MLIISTYVAVFENNFFIRGKQEFLDDITKMYLLGRIVVFIYFESHSNKGVVKAIHALVVPKVNNSITRENSARNILVGSINL